MIPWMLRWSRVHDSRFLWLPLASWYGPSLELLGASTSAENQPVASTDNVCYAPKAYLIDDPRESSRLGSQMRLGRVRMFASRIVVGRRGFVLI